MYTEKMSDLEIEFTNEDDGIMMALGESDNEGGVVFDAGKKVQQRNLKRRNKTMKKIEKAKARFEAEEDVDPSSFLGMSNRGEVPNSDSDADPEESNSDMSDDEGPGPEVETPAVEMLPSMGYKTIDDEKLDLLNKLQRLQSKGHTVKTLNIYSDIADIRAEYQRITYGMEIDQGTRFAKKMLVTAVSGLEFLNTSFNPLDIDLEGFGDNTMENIDDYEAVLEDLVVKYRTSAKLAPELKLILMLGGSAAQFHLTKTMLKSIDMSRPPASRSSAREGASEMSGPSTGGIENLMANFLSSNGDRPSTVSSRTRDGVVEPIQEVEDDNLSVSDIVSETESMNSKEISVTPKRKPRRSKKEAINVLTI